jgi:hypothetical protein
MVLGKQGHIFLSQRLRKSNTNSTWKPEEPVESAGHFLLIFHSSESYGFGKNSELS